MQIETKGNMKKTPNLLRLKDFCEKHSSFVSEQGMRAIIRNANKNGANTFLRRLGRLILIDEDKFFEWTEKREN